MTVVEAAKRVLELDAEATPGPWKHDDEGTVTSTDARCRLVGETECRHVFSALERGLWNLNDGTWEPSRDATLIAAYRTLAPMLAREVERLRSVVEAAREHRCNRRRYEIDGTHAFSCAICDALAACDVVV